MARTLQRYGAIVVTNSSGNGFQMLNPLSYTSIGQPNPWPSLVGPDANGYYGYAVSAIPGSRLRAMDPSGGLGVPRPSTLPTPGPQPTPVTPPTSGAKPGKGRITWASVLKRRVVRSTHQVAVVVTVRSKRAATLTVGAKKIGSKAKAVRHAVRLKVGKATTIIVRLPAKAGTRPRVALVIAVADAKGKKHTLRRESMKIAAKPR